MAWPGGKGSGRSIRVPGRPQPRLPSAAGPPGGETRRASQPPAAPCGSPPNSRPPLRSPPEGSRAPAKDGMTPAGRSRGSWRAPPRPAAQPRAPRAWAGVLPVCGSRGRTARVSGAAGRLSALPLLGTRRPHSRGPPSRWASHRRRLRLLKPVPPQGAWHRRRGTGLR